MEMTPGQFDKYHSQVLKRIEYENENRYRQSAMICCMLANINRDTKKRRKPYEVSDFMPKKKFEPKKAMKIEVMAEVLKAITIALGGEIDGNDGGNPS